MKHNYTHLDEDDGYGKIEPFRIPPVKCGDYITTGIFGEEYKFYVRRMPRRQQFTGHFGLFYNDPDAGETLIAVLRGGEFEATSPNFQFSLQNFVSPKDKQLIIERCCWCGRKLTNEETKIHPNCLTKSWTVEYETKKTQI